jgi:hypothetical protein
MNLDDWSTTESADTGLELAMQELETIEAPFWGTWIESAILSAAVSLALT